MLLKNSKHNFIIDNYTISFIYSYLMLFVLDKSIYDMKTIVINNSILGDFHKSVSKALSDILTTTYKTPSLTEQQKHSSRFEKIYFDNKIYKINYTSSFSGRLAFGIFCLISFIEETKKNGDYIIIEM